MSPKKRIQKWRWLAEFSLAFLLLGLPFLRINGESALRFDIPSLRLYFFGTELWMEEFFIVLSVTLLATFVTVLGTLLFGRIWCGWLCPQTIIIDMTRFIDNPAKKPLIYKALSYLTVFLISVIVAADLMWYFISPYDFFARIMTSTFGTLLWGFWIVLTLLTFLQFTLVRRKFCATVCPYAKLQDVLFDNKTLLVAFNPERKEECLNCKACVKICPVGIDIRKGFNATCINCARCVDECTLRMGKKDKMPLISYVFGSYSDTRSIVRPNVIVVSIVSIVFLALSLYLVGTRKAFDFSIVQNYDFKPKIINNKVINTYTLKVKNMQREPASVVFDVKGINNIQFVQNNLLTLQGDEIKGITVFVEAPLSDSSHEASLITITAQFNNKVTVEKQVNFLLPFY